MVKSKLLVFVVFFSTVYATEDAAQNAIKVGYVLVNAAAGAVTDINRLPISLHSKDVSIDNETYHDVRFECPNSHITRDGILYDIIKKKPEDDLSAFLPLDLKYLCAKNFRDGIFFPRIKLHNNKKFRFILQQNGDLLVCNDNDVVVKILSANEDIWKIEVHEDDTIR